ncbi:MAG: LPS export ABC transporter periplasmic protein LptC [Ignavibacteriales bacterium]|nr:LPS export ABC transporter periplasmic protein LptC [Ignavibacteriales bacterium]
MNRRIGESNICGMNDWVIERTGKTKFLFKILNSKIVKTITSHLAAICLFFAILISGCAEEKVKPPIDPSLSEKILPSQEGWNSKVNFTDEGKLKAILYYQHMRMYNEKSETLLDKIKIDFYNENEIKTTTLTSLKGRVDDITKNMWAIDSVVAKNDSGVTLTTQELMWRQKDKKIVSDKFVTIISPKEKIQGYGFESDQNLKNYIIFKITYITTIDNTKQKTN